MLLAQGCNSIFIFLLPATLKLILNVEGGDKEVNIKQRQIHGFTENVQLHRSKREFGELSNQCENIEDDLIYCPFKYTFQISAKFQTTQAEVALCKKSFSTCPTKLNTSAMVNGCHYLAGCTYADDSPFQCKVLGASCLSKKGKNGEMNHLECCNGRISTSAKEKVEVIGECNTTSNICEPKFPLNTACGDGSKEYLSCFDDNNFVKGRCVYPMELSTDKVRKDPQVKRSIKKFKNGTEEQGICLQNTDVDTCDEKKNAVNIFCGPKLLAKYDNLPFCSCPSPDLVTGYQCDTHQECNRCGLLGSKCTEYYCCKNYKCVNGHCVKK